MLKVKLNLRKVIAIAICLAGTATMFAQETGVVINGVKWATRNVDKPGTFVTNPEDAGMFYQWNRRVGWSATDPMINSDGGIDWNSSISTGSNTWEKSNDPSPVGWRVPTLEEIKKLLDTEKVTNEWTSVNGVNGRKFTDKATGNSIFLPAAGFRNSNDGMLNDGMLNDVSLYNHYWSSTPYDHFIVYELFFGDDIAERDTVIRYFGLSIRPVAE